jgi:hypothetical protein
MSATPTRQLSSLQLLRVGRGGHVAYWVQASIHMANWNLGERLALASLTTGLCDT